MPSEYLTNLHIRERLAPIKLSKYGEDTLFYLFYTNINDVLQLAAAAELLVWRDCIRVCVCVCVMRSLLNRYAHDWRYHRAERMWLTRAPGYQATKFDTYEQGTYLFFDPKLWRKVPKEFRLEYEKLEDKPQLPNANNYHPAHSQVHWGPTSQPTLGFYVLSIWTSWRFCTSPIVSYCALAQVGRRGDCLKWL